VVREGASRRSWSALLGGLSFVVAVVLLTTGVIGWQRARAARAESARQARRFPGAETVLWRGSELPSASLGVRVRTAILRDAGSARYYDSGATTDSIVDSWRTALAAIGADTRVVTPAEALADGDEEVLIVPASPCLGSEARHAIDAAAHRGVGLLVTWLAGVRDGGCRRVGYGLITELSGASRLDTLESARGDCYVTFLRGGPLASDIPPGARLELAIANHVALRTPRREAYFSDYMLNPRPANGEPLVDGAVVQTTVDRSRVVYWGFDLRSVVDRPWDRALALRLTRNSIAWAARVPLATIEPWPDGKAAAAVFAQDVEDEFANARNALDSLRAIHVPGTYYLVTRLAEREPALSRAMAAEGEIGTHTPRHRLLGGRPEKRQEEVLEESQQELADLIGHRVAGLRPPEEQYDTATLAAWVHAGGRYVFATLNGRAASPEILSVDDKPLVMLGRVTNDDFIEIGRRGLTNVDSLTNRFIAAYEKVRALGGLYILSYHSQMLSRPELVPTLARVARHVVADTAVWVTTAGSVADWWLRRTSLSAHARSAAPDRVVLEVSNAGAAPVASAVVRIAIGAATGAIADNGARVLDADDSALRVLLPVIPARGTFTTTIDLAGTVPNVTARLESPAPRARAALRLSYAR
jgi:peptidoglycan/xylan/chitin deacetylase (PgdA/CDA1 family)